MNTKISFLLFILLFVFQNIVEGQVTIPPSEDYIEGRIRIKLKKEQLIYVNSSLKFASTKADVNVTGVQNIDDISKIVGIKSIKRVFPFSLKNEEKHRKYGLHLWYEFEFDEKIDPQSVVEQYEKLSEIEIVKPIVKKHRLDANTKINKYKFDNNNIRSISKTTDYVPFLMIHCYQNNGITKNDGSIVEDGYDIDLFTAWEENTGSSEVIVSVVDQGIDVNHEDLSGNIWRNEAEINGVEGVDDDQNGYIDDFYGYNFRMDGAVVPEDHGTHVAGVIGAVSNNGIGISGIAGGNGESSGVKIISCQVFDYRASGGANFAAAIVYGADQGAVISQNSWGYNTPNYYEPEVYDAIKYFIAEAGQYEGSPMKGGIFFFAAGNDFDNSNRYPGAFDEVMAVTALGPDGLPAIYTNVGEWTSIAAPGGDQVTHGEEAGILSTITNNEYGYMDGTSMACPHVSGVAALVISKFGGSDFTAEDLKRIIQNSSKRFIFQHDNLYGVGALNAGSALADDNRIPPQAITDLGTSDVFHNEVRLEWTVPVDEDNGEPRSYLLSFGVNEITANNFDSQYLYIIENELKAGETFNLNFGGLTKKTDYWFAIKSIDRFENTSEISNVLKVTTSDLPHFMESTRLIDLEIDVTANAIHNVPLSFSNIGDGIVYWNTIVQNEEYYFEVDETTKTIIPEITKKENIKTDSTELYTKTRPYTKSINDTKSDAIIPDELDHWQNDVTEFVSGITYQNETNPETLLGSGNPNSGLILATRYDLPNNYSFNLTHLEIALIPEINNKPIIIELKKGSKYVEKSETVYMQEYYPDTVNVLKYYRIPLYRPQRFEDNEIFWVVLHFPKEMEYPVVLQLGDVEFGYSLMSDNNGISFKDVYYYLLRSSIPMLGVYSTGNDGSYVFMEPNSGEIHKGQTTNPNVIIDATNLTNGKHLASLGIATNDIHKPIVNIEVKVNVTGQKPVVDTDQVFSFKAYANVENNLEFIIKNEGLAGLEIYDAISQTSGISLGAVDSTITILPDYTRGVTVNFTPDTTGFIQTQVTLVTNIGDINLITEFSISNPPVLNIIALDTVDVNFGETATLDLELENTGTSVLEYNLEHYDDAKINNGIMSIPLNYQILTSSDIGGPADSIWDEIKNYANVIAADSIRLRAYDLGLSFPFYNEFIETAYSTTTGYLNFYYDGVLGNDPEAEFYGSAKAAFYPFKISGHFLRTQNLYEYSFGDRVVYNYVCDIIEVGGSVRSIGEVEYQVALFKNGAIEFRYKKVDFLQTNNDYTVAIQGLKSDSVLLYRDYNDTTGKDLYNGKVIRFQPVQDLSLIVNTSSVKGTIAGGQSKNIQLTIAPEHFNVTEGTYSNKVLINTNTANKAELHPITINVSGNLNYSTQQDTLSFDTIRLGEEVNDFVVIENTGSATGSITSVSVDNPDYIVNVVMPKSITGKAILPLEVNYKPTAVSQSTASLTINFSDGTNAVIILKGACIEDPSFNINISEPIMVDINGGELKRIPFNIENLTNSASADFTFKSGWTSWIETAGVQRGNGELNDSQISEYGYWWGASSDSKPFYKWEDITDDAELLFIEQDNQYLLELPFEFPFYDELYNKIWISKNGYITVVEPESDYPSVDFEKGDGLSGMIAPFWSYLGTSQDGQGVKMKVNEEKLILQWDEFISPGQPGYVSFQLEVYKNGTIFFHYKDLDTWTYTLNYGIESPDESETLETVKSWILSWSILANERSIMFNPPLKDKLNSSETKDFELVVSADNIFSSGVYKDTIQVYSNSFAQSFVEIPIQLNVTGSPSLKPLMTIDMGEVIFNENLKISEKVELLNTGHDPLIIDHITYANLEDLTLYDELGIKMIKTSAGELLNPIVISPWKKVVVKIEIPISTQQNLAGTINWIGNFTTESQEVKAQLIDSPIFSWDATDQNFTLNNSQTNEYKFNITNNGETNLEYNLTAAVVPSSENSEYPIIIEDDGYIISEAPLTVDSVAIESKAKADGVFTPFISSNLAFSSKFTAPVGGFFLTHAKTYTYLQSLNEYITLWVYIGGDSPQAGELIYEENFLIDRVIDEEWIYLPLKQPITLPEGTEFYIIVTHPLSPKYMGFDNTTDIEAKKNSFIGVYQSDNQYYWIRQDTEIEGIYKLRGLTAAGKDSWIELDKNNGELLAGESESVTASINTEKAGKGEHSALVIAKSNDINNSKKDFKVSISINGAPEFKYYPNFYKDTLELIETEKFVLNYLFEDPEGDQMVISIENTSNKLDVELDRLGDNTAQVEVKTNYESQGIYSFPVQVIDDGGSLSNDTIVIKVLDKNRSPILNPEFESLTLNLADPSGLTINPYDLFTDPDGDDLQIFTGNYNPEIVDMALGSAYMHLSPLKVGTAIVLFAADDGKEDGFVIYAVYVQVIDDPDAINSELDNVNDEEILDSDEQQITLFPNPVEYGKANFYIKLNEDADVLIRIYNSLGYEVLNIDKSNMYQGINEFSAHVGDLATGIYYCQFYVNNKLKETCKMIVK